MATIWAKRRPIRDGADRSNEPNCRISLIPHAPGRTIVLHSRAGVTPGNVARGDPASRGSVVQALDPADDLVTAAIRAGHPGPADSHRHLRAHPEARHPTLTALAAGFPPDLVAVEGVLLGRVPGVERREPAVLVVQLATPLVSCIRFAPSAEVLPACNPPASPPSSTATSTASGSSTLRLISPCTAPPSSVGGPPSRMRASGVPRAEVSRRLRWRSGAPQPARVPVGRPDLARVATCPTCDSCATPTLPTC